MDRKKRPRKFARSNNYSYLCRIAWPVHREWRAYILIKDVYWRLSCRNINFAKATTVTDRAMKRLRCKRRVVTPARGVAIGAAFMVHLCWRGHSLVAYPDG